MIFHDFTKNNGFQNIKIKLNSTTWMTLECSVVIFQALEYLWPQWPQQPQQPQWPQWPQQPHFKKLITEFYVSINHGTKKTYPGLSMWNGSSKTHYFIDFWPPFSWRLWRPSHEIKIKFKGQMSKPNEYTDNFRSNLTCIFLSVRAKLKKQLCPRTLCMSEKRPNGQTLNLGQRLYIIAGV